MELFFFGVAATLAVEFVLTILVFVLFNKQKGGAFYNGS